MESNTGAGQLFDIGSLDAEFCQLQDPRKARGKRYRLETVLTLLVLAKVCGEDKPSGIAEWAKYRMEWLCEALHLERKSMPHRSSYERILEQVVSWAELEQLVSRVWSGKRWWLSTGKSCEACWMKNRKECICWRLSSQRQGLF